MKNILVPTDFSQNAYNSLFYATRFFQEAPCKFYLLHTFEEESSRLTSRVDIGRSEEVFDELFKEAELKLTELMHTIVRDTEGMSHQFETVCSSKKLTKEINYLIKGMDIDYVVMGAKGRTAAHDVFLGSNTNRAIKKIKGSPLLVIPEEIDFKKPGKIGFATSFKYPYSDFEITALRSLAQTFSASIHIMYVQEQEKISVEQREHLGTLRSQLDSITHDLHWIEKTASKTEAVLDFTNAAGIDLLALSMYKHGFLKRLFRESVAKKLGQQQGIPIVLIPASS